MAKVDLQGYNTLGEKHKRYNQLFRHILQQDSVQHLSQVNYDDSDLDNILKIDIACYKRNVSYILGVLNCEDMLYIKKALRRSVWLITDEQYANIINPKFLHTVLFPYMSSKAINKLSLHIRLNLKNESRVEEFFNYYKDTNINIALKWLPRCSMKVIENTTATYGHMINVDILKRLCKKSIKVLQIFVENQKYTNKLKAMEATMFLMKTNLEEYMNIVLSLNDYEYPKLGAKYTRMIMKNAPHTILNNFEKFARTVHLQTFIKCIDPKNVAPLLLQYHRNEDLQYWFSEENIKPFILAMPQESRTEFVKKFLIDKNFDSDGVKESYLMNLLAHEKNYHWYKYIPFEIAFSDIKKLIQRESSSNERNSMFMVLLHSAGHNMQHIEILLQYYKEKHINEPKKFKNNFVYALIEQFKAVIFNNSIWKILNELFLSMEVYSESTNSVQIYITVAIIHKILYNETVPELLNKKNSFPTLKHYRNSLNEEAKEIVFNYFYKNIIKQIEELSIVNESDLRKGLGLIENLLTLLSDWEKDLMDFPLVLNKVNKLIEIKRANFWNTDLSCLYNVNRSWRIYFFDISLNLCISEDSCLNVLKHNPKLLTSSQDVLKYVHSDKTHTFKKLLNKMRIYWPTSTNENISICLSEIEVKNNMKALRHIIILLPQKSLLDIVKKYIPNEDKINWNNYDESLLNIRKCIAKCIHTARPQPSIEAVLWYAKGDYLQYTLPSLNAKLYNMSCVEYRQSIKMLIEGPVSLRKYGIRIGNEKLHYDDVIDIFTIAWESTKNKSIRADIFKCSFKLLCKEKDVLTINSIWALLESFIDTLSDEENKIIYSTLGEVNEVPLCVRVNFWKKSYQFLNGLPNKSEHLDIIKRVISSSAKFMEVIDIDFITAILVEDFKQNLMEASCDYIGLICNCLLSSDSQKIQNKVYIKLFLPIMEQCISSWNAKRGDDYLLRWKLGQLLKNLCNNFYDIVLKKKKIIPDDVFHKIFDYLQHNLPIEENYLLMRTLKFSYTLVKIIGADEKGICISYENDVFTKRSGFDDYLIAEVIPQFGVKLLQYLKDDIKLYSPSIFISFTAALKLFWQFFYFDTLLQLHMLKSILNPDVNESYLVALNSIPKFVCEGETELKKEVMEMISAHPSPEVKMYYNNTCDEELYSKFIY